MVMTYNSLVAQVLDYVERSDASTVAQIPNFIYQAEQRICRECLSIGLLVNAAAVFVPGATLINKPARWRKTVSFKYIADNSKVPLYKRTTEFLDMYWPDTDLRAAPKFYSDYSFGQILIAPTPDAAYEYLLSYLELPVPISAANQTNWLTDYAPDVLLYATLLETVPYLKNLDMVQIWKDYYERGLASLNQQDKDRKVDAQSDVEAS